MSFDIQRKRKTTSFANFSWIRKTSVEQVEVRVEQSWECIKLSSPKMTILSGTDCNIYITVNIFIRHAHDLIRKFVSGERKTTRFHTRSRGAERVKPTAVSKRRRNQKGFVLRQTFRNFSILVRLHLTEIWFRRELLNTPRPRGVKNNTSATKRARPGDERTRVTSARRNDRAREKTIPFVF